MTLPVGTISLNDVNVELGLSGTTTISMNQTSVRTLAGVPSGQISMSNLQGKSNVVVPAGLIVPLYNTSSTPSGWSDFTAPNGRLIVGAGSSYSSGSTGGSSTATISGTTSSTGAHNPTSSLTGETPGSSPPECGAWTNSAGAHTHTFSSSVSTTDAYKTFKLIKASANTPKLPANAMLFGSTSLSGLTNVETSTSRFLMANTSYGSTGGSSTPSGSATTSTNGDHYHGYANDSGDGSYNQRAWVTTGNHNHSLTVNVSLNTKKAILSAWTNASAEFNLAANGIALWESATPPEKWFICNGANGTLDLRDYFLYIGNTSNQGTRNGDNSASWSISQAAFSTAHNHYYTTIGSAPGGARSHLSYAWSHTHTASGSQSIVQPYYALYFIQYGG